MNMMFNWVKRKFRWNAIYKKETLLVNLIIDLKVKGGQVFLSKIYHELIDSSACIYILLEVAKLLFLGQI